MKPVKIGSYRHLITIEQSRISQDEFNEDVQEWTEVATVRASMRSLSGRQLALAQANTITSTATMEIRMRYREELKEAPARYRLRYGANPLDYEDLETPADFYLDTNGFSNLQTNTPTSDTRYFAINYVNDVEERRNELILTCTEVKG